MEGFRKINKTRLSDQIILQIRQMIDSGQLQRGEQLPSERDLAAQLEVSRLPLREALKALEATQVIESRSGDGYYVCGLATDSLVQLLASASQENHDTLTDLQEARLIVEVAAVKLSCIRRTKRDIDLMQESIHSMRRALDLNDKDETIHYSLDFHRYMVGAAHNQMLSSMLECISTVLREGRTHTEPARYIRSIQEHGIILQAIVDKDAERAQALLHEHLSTAYNI